jgi:hypothetical protein
MTLGITGTTPAVTVSAGGCLAFINPDGGHETISNSAKNIKLSNPGSTTVTVDVAYIVG